MSTATTPYRLLHTMIRVRDLDASLNFYVKLMGMKLLRKNDYPGGEFTLAFVGYGDEANQAVIELPHNWGRKEPYARASGTWPSACPMPTRPARSWARQGSRSPVRRGR